MPEQLMIHDLVEGWSFKRTSTDEWLAVEKVPTNVHLDLLRHKKIEDPFVGFNELDCEWVGKESWTYRVSLPNVSKAGDGVKHVLALDGLDTFATVKLGDRTILESDNMWITHRLDLTDKLNYGKENVLEIEFRPALLEAQKIKDAHPNHTWIGFNGDMARLAVRKAQYHWGWDWGPILSPCGPWRPVRLESYLARVADLRIDYEVQDSLKAVTGIIKAVVEGEAGEVVRFSAQFRGVDVFKTNADVGKDGVAEVEFHINEPRLWFPHGYGPQHLYTVTAELLTGKQVVHLISKRTAFRKAELVQKTDQIGKSFYFRINNIDVFCGGSNWIPADSFTPRITKEKYRRWIRTLVDGHQVMARVWGGGIWEDDAFYEACDEMGVLIWHDFMFACGNYPCFDSILESIKAEAVVQVKRLRHHPSIVIYAGNNEDYQVAEQNNLTYDYEDKDPQHWLRSNFPARFIYEKLLPEVVATHAPQVAYHPGSPWGDGKITTDPTVGDMHQWNVWHGTQEKYQIFDTLGGRFNSEFGLEAFPHIATIKHFITDDGQLYPQSAMMDFHNKAAGHERRIATYLVENFRTQTELEKFIHLTQLSQAEALTFAYRGWRKQWGQQRGCGGALVWQLNDCWPVISWSIVDYFLRKKPAYYAMRRALAPIAVAVKRSHHDWSVVHARPAKTSDYECWVASSKTIEVVATVELRFVSISTGKDIKERRVRSGISIAPNGTTEVFRGSIDHSREEAHVLAARLWVDGEEQVRARDTDWPQPIKYLELDERGVEVNFMHERAIVTAQKPTKGLVFEEREKVLVGDGAIDIVPGDVQVISIHGLASHDAPLTWTYLGAP